MNLLETLQITQDAMILVRTAENLLGCSSEETLRPVVDKIRCQLLHLHDELAAVVDMYERDIQDDLCKCVDEDEEISVREIWTPPGERDDMEEIDA